MEKLENSKKFQWWKRLLKENGINFIGVNELHSVRKPNGEILFSLVHSEAHTPEGNPLLPVAMIRGHFVSVLTALKATETGKVYYLLVCQRRVANGALFYEHPAGMMDNEADPAAVALKEMHEETGMEIRRDDLVSLTDEMIYSSPGLLDEGGFFFACELELPENEIMAYHLASKGEAGEGEFIQTYIATPEEARKLIKNANGLLNIYLYEDWKRKNVN